MDVCAGVLCVAYTYRIQGKFSLVTRPPSWDALRDLRVQAETKNDVRENKKPCKIDEKIGVGDGGREGEVVAVRGRRARAAVSCNLYASSCGDLPD